MKNLLPILFIIILLGCKSSKSNRTTDNNTKNESTECEITKIDSIENYYIVYAKGLNNHIGYKIISRKETKNLNLERVKKSKIYKLKLIWVSEPSLLERKGNYLDFKRCNTYYPLVKICTEAGYELYETEDLKGLYYGNVGNG